MSCGTAERGCGKRQFGAIYAEVHVGPHGRPLEEYLVDPPQCINPIALGVSPVGVMLLERSGLTHVVDWVSHQHYRNVADFVEEARRLGISRRLSKALNFKKLTPGSRLILVHARAYIDNYADYYPSHHACPKGKEKHQIPAPGHLFAVPEEHCASLWWEDVVGGKSFDNEDQRWVLRTMPSFSYKARSHPANVKPLHHPAIFMSVPIHNLAVIVDPHAETEKEALAAVANTQLAVALEEA